MSEPKLTTRDALEQALAGTPSFGEFASKLALLLAQPAPQPEAKAEPDYTCPICGKDARTFRECRHNYGETIAAANARIAELVRERDEMEKEASAAYDRGIAKGVAAAKEACAKRLEREAALESINFEHAIAAHKMRCARVVRELDVDAPLTDTDKRLQEYADKTWGPDE